MIGKNYLIAAFAAVLIGGVWSVSAVPAYPRPVVYTLSDGTQITVRVVGDEFHHYVLSEDGYTLTGGEDGDYYYATLAPDGTLVPTSVKARPVSMLTRSEAAEISSLQRGLRPAANNNPLLQRPRPVPVRVPAAAAASGNLPAPPGRISSSITTGKLRSLVILVETSDKSFTTPTPQQAFSALLNEQGYSRNGALGSAWDYYNDNSNGRFDPDFVVIGPYKVSNKASYYAGSSGSGRVPELVVEACELADKDGVDFSQFADNGVIRDIFIFYAGYNQAEGAANTIWPHRWFVDKFTKYKDVRFDGVQLVGYACSSELKGVSGATMAGIGAFCHEFGHVLGWPDFYDTDYEGSGGRADGFENYSLMDAGSYNYNSMAPPALTMLERWMVGWAEPELLAEAGEYTLSPVWEDKGYLVPTGTNDDYFLIEARALGGFKWDNYIDDYYGNVDGSKGLFVMHIDNTDQYRSAWIDNTLNVNPDHECAKIVRSVPGKSSAMTPSRTFFPGAENVVTLTSTSNRDYLSWSGSEPKLSFTGIVVGEDAVKMRARTRTAGGETDYGLLVRFNQFDALLTWDDSQADKWNVKCTSLSDGKSSETEADGGVLYLDNLMPATTYELTLTPAGGEEVKAQIYEFTTLAIEENRAAAINLSQSEYDSNEYVALGIRNYAGTPERVEWYVNDELLEEHYTKLPAGEHRLVAAVVAQDGTKEYLIKYITVK